MDAQEKANQLATLQTELDLANEGVYVFSQLSRCSCNYDNDLAEQIRLRAEVMKKIKRLQVEV